MSKSAACATLLIVALGGCDLGEVITPRVENARHDVFPLENSRLFAYRYRAASSARSGIMYSASEDSGMMLYTIRGSARATGATIEWTVELRQILRRISSFGSMGGSSRSDTVWIDTTTVGSLTEATAGPHELTAAIGFWNFPLWTNPEGDTCRVYRYSDSSSVTALLRSMGDISTIQMVDTTRFEDGAGLVAKRRAGWNVGNSGWGFGMSADLVVEGK